MHFESIREFFAMGGYAGYVWTAYGISALSLLILLWRSVSQSRHLAAEIKNKIARERRIKAAEKLENTL
ncbi:heme exporter protein CcmD [Photobacterium sp. 53610]|uniref:heme exporter protein CcmD n=1 Tax=Photobacterium sp. 53610 TaxID=3102789 RepID=UPI002EDBA2F3